MYFKKVKYNKKTYSSIYGVYSNYKYFYNVICLSYCKIEYDHECYKVINNEARVDSEVCKTKYPLVLVHGVGFRDLKYINYWGRIPKELIRNGATVYYGNQEAWGTVEYNAKDIKDKILDISERNRM